MNCQLKVKIRLFNIAAKEGYKRDHEYKDPEGKVIEDCICRSISDIHRPYLAA